MHVRTFVLDILFRQKQIDFLNITKMPDLKSITAHKRKN